MHARTADAPRYDDLVGLRVTELGDGTAGGEVTVRDELKQPLGLIQGGVYPSIAESLSVLATSEVVREQGKVAVGVSSQTSFLRPITAGTIHARATARHRGRTTWVWDVEITDDAGRRCVMTRITLALREAAGAGS